MRKAKIRTTRRKSSVSATVPRVRRSLIPAGGSASTYQVTLVTRADLELITVPAEEKVAEAPRYDRRRDEPAFQRAWQKVAEAKARGEVAAVPPMPPGGIRLRGSRAKPGA